MALGGYKFAGKFCDLENLAIPGRSLLIHKTRLAAFMAANDLTDAGWSFDQTGGTIAFENYGNVIYSLDSQGNNLVSFLKFGDPDPTYYAILTCMQWTITSGTPSEGYVNFSGTLYEAGSGSFISELGALNTLFHRLSKIRLTVSNILSSAINSLRVMPASHSISRSPECSGTTYISSDSFLTASKCYCGYAIKNGSVLSFVCDGVYRNSMSVTAFSCDAFSSLYNSGDDNKIAMIIPTNYYIGFSGSISGETRYQILSNNSDLTSGCIAGLDSQGYERFLSAVSDPCCYFATASANLVLPYAGLDLYASDHDSTTLCYGKGVTNVDFACMNINDTYPSDLLATTANGNFIYIARWYTIPYFSGENSFRFGASSSRRYVRLFFGWDPSNPDITQSSAWTEYTPEEATVEVPPVIVA